MTDWGKVFLFSVSPWELFVRGSVMYLSLFVMLRLVLKRTSGTFALSDLLLIVVLADAAQNGMAGEYRSIADGLVLVATLIFWNYAIDYLGYRSPFFERLVHPAPLKLIENGRMLRRNMRKELITETELMSRLREEGFEAIADVKSAFMEGDGEISVIPKETTPQSPR